MLRFCLHPNPRPVEFMFLLASHLAAKNVILAGIKSVTLHDTETVILPHLSAQFYLSESDVGKNRAAACAGKLQELNKAVAVTVLTEELTEARLGDFQVGGRQPGARCVHVWAVSLPLCFERLEAEFDV